MMTLEDQVLKALKKTPGAKSPDVVKKAVKPATDSQVRAAIWNLVGRGEVKVVGAWNVQASKPTKPSHVK